MDSHSAIWNWHDQCSYAIQVFHLPSQRKLVSSMVYLLANENQDLGANMWTGLECVPNPVFTPHIYHLPIWFPIHKAFTMAPMQIHILVFATFASLIAPFGGFFASGLKRTFKIKDFGDSIPGHGGMTDRMDCQFIMGFFAYMYYHSFIAVYKVSLGGVIETAITGLTPEEQMELVKGISKHLFNQGVIPEGVSLPITAEILSNHDRSWLV